MDIKYLQIIKSTQSSDFSRLVKVTGPDVGPRDTGRRKVGRWEQDGEGPTIRFCTSRDRRGWGCQNGSLTADRQPAHYGWLWSVSVHERSYPLVDMWLPRISRDRKLHGGRDSVCFVEHRAWYTVFSSCSLSELINALMRAIMCWGQE